MMKLSNNVLIVCLLAMGALNAYGQTSSLGARERKANAGKISPVRTREAPDVQRNAVYDRYSWFAVPARIPKTFKVGDLITIIVRESRQYEADAALQSRRTFELQTSIDAFLRPKDGGVGSATFRRGKPEIDYGMKSTLRSSADIDREDRLTTRLTASIIDVKPNGVLVLEARSKVIHDDEVSEITLTGTCRKVDVTADNTILSTQIASKVVAVNNRGALRDASTRGWFHKLVDFLKFF